MEFISNNWGTIVTILLATEQLLAQNKKISANSYYQLITGIFNKAVNKDNN